MALQDGGDLEVESEHWETDGTLSSSLADEFRELFDECVGLQGPIPIFRNDMGHFYVRLNGACRYDTIEECRDEVRDNLFDPTGKTEDREGLKAARQEFDEDHGGAERVQDFLDDPKRRL